MSNINIQMKNKNDTGDWDNLFPVSLDSNVLDENGVSVKQKFKNIPIDVLSQSYKRKRTAVLNPVIVAYGDSNTRYYEGDNGKDGSVSLAYSTIIDLLTLGYPNLHDSLVINAGYSSKTIQYGLDNYTVNIKDNAANIAIIGFGTNDIKVQGNTLEGYINKMEQMINLLQEDGVVPVILGIPWYAENYAPGTETRIPVWNEALMKLCVERNVDFIDVYHMFSGKLSDIWFNEVSTPKRHYSIMAQKVLGGEIFKRILSLSGITPEKNQYGQEMFDGDNISWFNSVPKNVDFRTFVMGTDSIDCLVVPEGESLSFNVQGRYILGFYPRDAAVVEISGLGEFEIKNSTNDGLYYPLLKITDADNIVNVRTKSVTTVTVTAISGTLYLRYVGSEFSPREYSRGLGIVEKGQTSDGSYEIYTDGTAKAWGIRTITGVNTSGNFGGLKRNSGGNFGTNTPISFSSYEYANYHLVDAPTFGIVLNASTDLPHNFQLAFADDLNDATVKVAWEIKGKI